MPEWEWWAEDAPKWPRFLRFYWRRIVPSEAWWWLAWSAVAVVFAVVVTVGLLIDAADVGRSENLLGNFARTRLEKAPVPRIDPMCCGA
jgi:hypothetical protein